MERKGWSATAAKDAGLAITATECTTNTALVAKLITELRASPSDVQFMAVDTERK